MATMWRMFCYLFNKRDKGKQFFGLRNTSSWRRLQTPVVALSQINHKKSSEFLGGSGFFVYLCSRVIILSVGVHPFLGKKIKRLLIIRMFEKLGGGKDIVIENNGERSRYAWTLRYISLQ